MDTNTIILDDDARIIASQTARGSYQESLIAGEARWSGADLRGQARRYVGRYAASRSSLLNALRAAGLHVVEFALKSGRKVVALSSERCAVEVTYSAHGESVDIKREQDYSVLIPSRRVSTSRRSGTSAYICA